MPKDQEQTILDIQSVNGDSYFTQIDIAGIPDRHYKNGYSSLQSFGAISLKFSVSKPARGFRAGYSSLVIDDEGPIFRGHHLVDEGTGPYKVDTFMYEVEPGALSFSSDAREPVVEEGEWPIPKIQTEDRGDEPPLMKWVDQVFDRRIYVPNTVGELTLYLTAEPTFREQASRAKQLI